MKEKLKDRYLITALFFLAFGVVITLQLINLQVIQGAEYQQISLQKQVRERVIPAPRGKILDRNGIPIAVNEQGFAIYIVNTGLKSDELNDTLFELIKILEKNGDSYNNTLEKFISGSPIKLNKSTKLIQKWLKKKDTFNNQKPEQIKTAKQVFDFLRYGHPSEKMTYFPFNIAAKYSEQDAFKIMKLRYEILVNGWSFSQGNSICLARVVSRNTIAEVEERHHLLKGITTDIEPIRKYLDGQYIAHVLGNVGQINDKKLEEFKTDPLYKDIIYTERDIVGLAGIEESAERFLRGKDGQKRIEVDKNGRVLEGNIEDYSYLNGNYPATPGKDVYLTIDMNLQKVAMQSLEKNIKRIREMGGRNNKGDANAGAVVALDVKTGEVLAMASYPSYDPSIFLKGSQDKLAQQAINNLWKDSDSPSYNRAIQGIYAPGSTFKPLTSLAALEEGIITKDTIIYDSGTEEIGKRVFYCLEYKNGLGAHGKLDLKRALETSCNIYFHEIGASTTIDKMNKWARLFGLGEKTGIDIKNERSGILASKEHKEKIFPVNSPDGKWRPADTAQSAIGQLYNSFTPLQLANYISSIANGGKKFTPHLMMRVEAYDGNLDGVNLPKIKPIKIPVKASSIEAVKEGMVGVTHSIEGTANKVFKGYPFEVAGKTGTAETGQEGKYSSNALFVCYAPANDPQIAVAVVVERGAWGSNTAPIAKDILDEYFGLNSAEKYEDAVTLEIPIFTP